MSIASIIPALVDAVEAEIELDLATARHKLAVEVAEGVPAARARTDLRVAEEAAKRAYGALADAVADAPDSRAKSAIMSGAMRAALRGLDDAVARLGRVEERRARLTTDGIYDDCPKRLGWGDCCLGEFDVGISCDWERADAVESSGVAAGEAGEAGEIDRAPALNAHIYGVRNLGTHTANIYLVSEDGREHLVGRATNWEEMTTLMAAGLVPQPLVVRADGADDSVGEALDEMFPDSIEVSAELPAATTGAGQEPRK